MHYMKNAYSPVSRTQSIGAQRATTDIETTLPQSIGARHRKTKRRATTDIETTPQKIIPAPKNKPVDKSVAAIQKTIYALKCSDYLTLHEWTERIKTYYKARGGLPPFEGKFINVVGQAFITLYSKGHARQIVRDRFVNKSGEWQVIWNSNECRKQNHF